MKSEDSEQHGRKQDEREGMFTCEQEQETFSACWCDHQPVI